MKIGSVVKFKDIRDDKENPFLGIVTRIINSKEVTVRYCYSDSTNLHNGYGESLPCFKNRLVVIKE